MKYVGVTQMDGAVVLTPDRDLVGGPETDALDQALATAAAAGQRKVVVDLHKVQKMNVCGPETLVCGRARHFAGDGRIALCSLREHELCPTVVIWLVREFDTYAGLADAIHSLRQN